MATKRRGATSGDEVKKEDNVSSTAPSKVNLVFFSVAGTSLSGVAKTVEVNPQDTAQTTAITILYLQSCS